ncbi:hypothetical protein [Flavobacterium cerinum]|uniref:Uncharacterized protein n=1 Tax=Flavobacterium cerinum TaxID=2502784 RepID=A0ABY5IUP4_9FLAO|nr:hypothetical protein [Flavobacterium cerinum]UUC46546.1 hypothetical protein NOX80_04930 [Flavobacterium cerinum]
MATPFYNILQWFLQGKKPTQSNFEETFRSFWHKEEAIPTNTIEGLDQILNQKTDKTAFGTHLTDEQAHTVLFVSKENTGNKQNSLTPDNTGTKFPTVDAVNGAITTIGNAIDVINGQIV